MRGLASAPQRRYLSVMTEAIPIVRVRKPDWIRVKAPTSVGFAETKALMRRLDLATVCEEAAWWGYRAALRVLS